MQISDENSGLFLVVLVNNFTQIERIEPELADACCKTIREAVNSTGAKLVKDISTVSFMLYPPTREGAVKLVKAAKFLEKDFLDKAEALYGFNQITTIVTRPFLDVINELHELVFRTPEDGFWSDKFAGELLSTVAITSRAGRFWRIGEFREENNRPSYFPEWSMVQNYHLDKILDQLTSRINNGENPSGISLVTKDRNTAALCLTAVSERLVGSNNLANVPRFSMFNKYRLKAEPILNFLSNVNFDNVRPFLNTTQLILWDRYLPLIHELIQKGEDKLRSDNYLFDLILCMQLYLFSYQKSMEAANLPAVVLCDDVDLYHIQVRKWLAITFTDFLQASNSCILMSSNNNFPDELSNLPVTRNNISFINIESFELFAKSIFPELKIPKDVIKEILTLSNDRLPSVRLYLHFLLYTGNLIQGASGWEWVSKSKEDLEFPESSKIIALKIIEFLDKSSLLVLFVISINYRITNLRDSKYFLSSQGLDEQTIDDCITKLVVMGLLKDSPYLVPSFSKCWKQVIVQLAELGKKIKIELCSFLLGLWKKGGINDPVSLYSFFVSVRDGENAFKLFEFLINKYLDEYDYSSVEYMLSRSSVHRLSSILEKEQQEHFKLLDSASVTRAKVVFENSSQKTDLIHKLNGSIKYEKSTLFWAHNYLQQSRLYRKKGLSKNAVETAKEAINAYQIVNYSLGENESLLELAMSLLLSGKIEDALSYLSLIPSKYSKDRSLFGVRVVASKAVVAFLKMELAKVGALADQGQRIADNSARHEWAVFFCFIAARACFSLGLYQKALNHLMQGLNITEVYDLKKAAALLWRWAARCMAYEGNREQALRLLNTQTNSQSLWAKSEQKLFVAETYCLAMEIKKAHAIVKQIIYELPTNMNEIRSKEVFDLPITVFPSERPVWENGFIGIEGHCLKPGFSIIRRYSVALESYLRAQFIHPEQVGSAIDVLSHITRKEDLDYDPHAVYYHLMYSRMVMSSVEKRSGTSASIIGRGVGILRERANQIRSPYERSCFMNNDPWHSSLMIEARKLRLV